MESHRLPVVEYEPYLLNILDVAGVLIRHQNTHAMLASSRASPVSLVPFDPAAPLLSQDILITFTSQSTFTKYLLPFHFQSEVLK